ncbi:MAG TPA: hypothetical protein VIL63_00430, partial [Terriglobales bacterium]
MTKKSADAAKRRNIRIAARRISAVHDRPLMAKPAPTHPRARPAPAPRVGFVSLGCPKALVDSEQILTRLSAEGYT